MRTQHGNLTSDVRFTTQTVHAGSIAGDRATGSLSITGDNLLATVDLFSATRTILGVDANGDLRARHFEVPRLIFSPTPEQTWVGNGTQMLTLADDGIDGLRVAIDAGSASIAASGSVHTDGPVALDVRVVALPLSTLDIVDAGFAGYEGRVDVTAAASGTGKQLVLAVDATAEDVVVPGSVRGIHARVRAEARDDAVVVDASVADAKNVLATLKGSVPITLDLHHPGFRDSNPLDLRLDVHSGTAEAWNAVLDAVQVPPMRGSAQASVSGTALHPEVRVSAVVELPPAHKGEPWIGFDVDASAVHERLTVAAAMREGDQHRAGLDGTARFYLDRIAAALLKKGPAVNLADPANWADDLDFTVRPDLPLQTLQAFVAVPDGVRGRLVGEAHLRGSPVAPTVDGQLSVDAATLDRLKVSPATLAFSPRAGGYDVDANVGFGEEGGIHAAAFLPLTLQPGAGLTAQFARQGFTLDVSGAGVPLRAVAAVWPEMQDADGRLMIAGRLGGSLTAPVGNLTASTKDAAFRLESTGVAYDQVGFALAVDPAAVRLRDFHVRTANPGENPDRAIQGTIDASVEAQIHGTTLGEWKGNVSFNRPLLSAVGDRYLRLATGKFDVSGVPPALTVNGALVVEEARIHLDERFFSGLGTRDAPAWLHVHRSHTKPQAEAPVPPPAGVPDWLRAHVKLDLGGNTFLRANLPLGGSLGGLLGPFASVNVDTQADGHLSIAANKALLSVTGEVLPLRGTTILFGKPFDIRDDSTISFTGRDFASPILNLHAVYDTRAYGIIDAEISGVPEALKVRLTSPDYPSQDDVISMLLVGKPASEMSSGEGAGDGASAAAMAMLLTTVGQTLGREGERAAAMVIAPDLLVVGNETARVGKRIGRSLFVVVDIDNAADDQTTSYLTLTVELALGGPWEAEFVHGTAGEDALGVNWTRRY